MYLAVTEDVLRRVAALDEPRGQDRIAAVQRILTVDVRPMPWPVLLVNRRLVDRTPGLYELDELRRTEQELGPLVTSWLEDGALDGREEVILVESSPATVERELNGSEPGGIGTRTRIQTSRVLPQGAFELLDLSIALAEAEPYDEALAAAVRATPPTGPLGSAGTLEPWRVVITCPVPEGQPEISHRVVFTGDGGAEPPIVTGTPAGGRDAALEASAAVDLHPAEAVARLERRNTFVLAGELAVLGAAAALAWASGGLAYAARETPGWLGFGIVMALTALIFAIVPRFAPNETERSPDDTLELRRYYRSRLDLLRLAPSISAAAFAVAVLCAVVPPTLVDRLEVSPPTITFDASSAPVIARVQVAASGVGTDARIGMEIRTFSDAEAPGVLVGHVVSSGDSTGAVRFDTDVAMRSDTRYLAVQTWVAARDDVAPICTPADPAIPGCTVVAVPPLGADASMAGTSGTSSSSLSSTVVVGAPATAAPSPALVSAATTSPTNEPSP